jgi:hypothetical protein
MWAGKLREAVGHMAGASSMNAPRILMQKITSATPVFPSQLALTWADGFSHTVEVGHWLKRHSLLEMLNIREVFEDMSILYDGRALGWANGADFCADALRSLAEEQAKTKRIPA